MDGEFHQFEAMGESLAAQARRGREPSIEQLMEWEAEGGCEATDGCWVEPDGICPHGCPSWLLVMGLI